MRQASAGLLWYKSSPLILLTNSVKMNEFLNSLIVFCLMEHGAFLHLFEESCTIERMYCKGHTWTRHGLFLTAL